jgi:hypothetical protein
MNAGVINIGCSLPHGLVLTSGHPTVDPKTGKLSPQYQAVELNGLSKAKKPRKYGVTLVPVATWVMWVGENNTLRYVVDGSVFIVDGQKCLHALTLKPLK